METLKDIIDSDCFFTHIQGVLEAIINTAPSTFHMAHGFIKKELKYFEEKNLISIEQKIQEAEDIEIAILAKDFDAELEASNLDDVSLKAQMEFKEAVIEVLKSIPKSFMAQIAFIYSAMVFHDSKDQCYEKISGLLVDIIYILENEKLKEQIFKDINKHIGRIKVDSDIINIYLDRILEYREKIKTAGKSAISREKSRIAILKAEKEAEQKAPSWSALEELWNVGNWTDKGRGQYANFANYVTRTNQAHGMTYDAIRNYMSKYDKKSQKL